MIPLKTTKALEMTFDLLFSNVSTVEIIKVRLQEHATSGKDSINSPAATLSGATCYHIQKRRIVPRRQFRKNLMQQ